MTDEPATTTLTSRWKFADGWRVDAFDAATIEVTTDENGIPAWLLALARI
jgi:hypothetical protein